MLDLYRHLANRIGTPDALALAHDLSAWHDDMVRHQRALDARVVPAEACEVLDDCPHVQARELWRQAQSVYGEAAATLTFLRTAAAPMPAAAAR